MTISRSINTIVCAFVASSWFLMFAGGAQAASEPRIVNIYNFCRDNDYRATNSKAKLYEATVQQIRLLKKFNLSATFALQYDALMNTNYQNLFKKELGKKYEIAAWWEIPQELAEKAGLKWRSDHEWDPRADVGFSPGYTLEERRKLVDVYMADFKAIFGYYPKTVGSWYIDEVTLAYMADKYGIVASCNCRDQIGVDFYTLWGGYWNQAYYPSRLNAYMPAQTRAGQIDVPIFRMLGSDPIYQHGTTPGTFTLEPIYRDAGFSTNWVAWFMNELIHEPSLAFAYTQAGQENSFGWSRMKTGLTHQFRLFAELEKAGKIRVETLEQSGKWFRKQFRITPPTSMVALNDWQGEGRKTVWYDSRFYRLNILWQNGGFFIRDLHCFDQNMVSPTHNTALTNTVLAYETLPVIDWAFWHKKTELAGMWPVLLSSDGTIAPMTPDGPPEVKELTPKELIIRQSLDGGGTFTIVCAEANLTCAAVNGQGQPLRWAWNLVGGSGQESIVQTVTPQGINYQFKGTDYQLRLVPNSGSCQKSSYGDIQIFSNNSGKLVLNLAVGD
jgi:hypothetical protein